jgi:OmpA-OmpF porin, OOP family
MATVGRPISFDPLVREISSRYHLGPKGRSLAEAAVDMIASEPGGIGDFLDRFRDAGFTAEVSSWLAGTDPVPLTGQELEQTLGSDAVSEIADKSKVSQRFARTVLGYAIPRIINVLAQSGFLNVAVPPSSWRVGQIPRRGEGQLPLGGREASRLISPRLSEMLIPAAALLILLGSLGYVVSSGQMRLRGGAPQSSPITAQSEPTGNPPAPQKSAPMTAEIAPAAIRPVPSIPARLKLTNKNGLIIYSGTVGDDATRTAITDSLKRAFGADNISGNVAVDQHAGPADWTQDLNATLDNFTTPGSQALFEGDAIRIGGMIPDAVRDRIISSLKSTLGLQFAYATVPGSGAIETATASAERESGISGTNSVRAPNQPIANSPLPVVYFATNSAEVPSDSKASLQQAAGLMKQLPAGTVVRISGFADSTGNPAANKSLSQRRADDVRQLLIKAGVDPAMLNAKGYGSPPSVAISENATKEGRSGSTMESRLREDRRVEFRIAQK